METEINEAIKMLAQKAKSAPAHEALHLTQSALNLAQVLQIKKYPGETKVGAGQHTRPSAS